MYRKKYTQPKCIFFRGQILQNLKKTCKKEDFWFKKSRLTKRSFLILYLSKFPQRFYLHLHLYYLQKNRKNPQIYSQVKSNFGGQNLENSKKNAKQTDHIYSCISTYAHSCLKSLSNKWSRVQATKSMFKSWNPRAVWTWL